MKNYYIQLCELRIAKTRLETLKEKKGIIETKIMSTTSQIKEVVVSTNANKDNMTEYLIKIEELNKQIEEVEKEIKILKKGLHIMDEILNNISGIEERVFRLYFIENKTPTQISFIIPCDRTTVYRYIRRIREKYEVKKL